jgi:hypothetical protein
LTGVTYAADKEYDSSTTVAAISFTAAQYASDKHLTGVRYAAQADLNRLASSIAFSGSRLNEVWPYVSGVLDLEPVAPLTPGLSLEFPVIPYLDVVGRDVLAANSTELQYQIYGLAGSTVETVRKSLVAQGFAESSPLCRALTLGYTNSGFKAAINSVTQYEIAINDMAGESLSEIQSAAAEGFARQQALAVEAEANLIDRQLGLLAAVTKIANIKG